MPFDASDLHRVNACQGWLMLSAPVEAEHELDQLSRTGKQEYLTLELYWQCYAGQKLWDKAYECAERMIVQDSTLLTGWIQRAYAARRRPGGNVELARALLLPARELFPGESLVPYNLACYDAQLGALEVAWNWLQTAMQIDDPKQIRERALKDDDLVPLHSRLKELRGKGS